MVTETKNMVPAAIPGGKIKRTRITVLSINKWVLGMGLRDGQAGTPLFAHELIHDLRALLALDIAAPVKLAMAAFRLHRLKLVVTAAAAHELAAVHALGGLVAQAALRAQRAGALVAHTVVRARVDVDQVLRGRGVEAAVDLDQLAPAVESHGGRAVILLLEGIAHLSEVRQLQPARLEATRARHSMALAGYVGQVVYCLQEERREVTVQILGGAERDAGMSVVNKAVLRFLGAAMSESRVVLLLHPLPLEILLPTLKTLQLFSFRHSIYNYRIQMATGKKKKTIFQMAATCAEQCHQYCVNSISCLSSLNAGPHPSL